jgi:hypothetical protein
MAPPPSDDHEDLSGVSPQINPITGTTIAPDGPSLGDMTDEEKEREAEKLFVLFNRMEKLGMVANPIRQAQQHGKLEEVPDDHSD